MTINEKLQRRRRRKAAKKAIRNICEVAEMVDEICIVLDDSFAEIKIKGNAPEIEDEQDDN